MALALRSVGRALSQITSHLSISITSNVVAAVLALPLLAIVGILAHFAGSFGVLQLGIVIFVGVLPNPGAAGLQFVTQELAHNDLVNLGDVRDGLRDYGMFALKVWITSATVTIIILLNIGFYQRMPTPVSPLPEILWWVILSVWMAMHLYVYPLIFQQYIRRTLLVYRNAFIMSASRPVFTITATITWIAALLLGTATGLGAIIGLAVGAAIQQNATAGILPGLKTVPVTKDES